MSEGFPMDIQAVLAQGFEERLSRDDPLLLAQLRRHLPSVDRDGYRLPAQIVKMVFNGPLRRFLLADAWGVGARLGASRVLEGDPGRGADRLGLLETFDELVQYCRRVASAVGLMCIEIFGCRGAEARDYAVNLGLAAAHTAAVAGNLAKAAALTTSAGATKMAEFGVRFSSVAVQAAEQGVAGARDLAIVSAKISASTANAIANPDQGKVQVEVREQLDAYKAELLRLVKQNPGLATVAQPALDAAA